MKTPKGECIKFKRGSGLFNGMSYIDLREAHEGLAMLATVRKNYEGYTERQVKKAILACQLQGMVVHPTDESFKQMVSNKSLRNSDIRVEDVTNAHAIFGPHLPGLRGKTVRVKPTRVEPEYLEIPDDFRKLHRYVTLTGDVMFVNGYPFLVTLSRNIRLFTVELLPSRTAKQLSSSLNKIVKIYARGGYIVRLILMDMEFEKVKSEMDSVEINTTAAREHVGEIERGIRTLKERCRCVLAGLRDLGWLYLHKWVVVHRLYHVTKMVNSFPAKKGISAAWLPREIVTGRTLDVSVDLCASFGVLVDASYDKMVTNDMGDRTHPCIALGA